MTTELGHYSDYYYKVNKFDLLLVCKVCGCLVHNDGKYDHLSFHDIPLKTLGRKHNGL